VRSLVGTWKLIAETANDREGGPAALVYGGAPIGSATFTAEGFVAAILTDGRIDGTLEPRTLTAFCGRYTFDGTQLVMRLERLRGLQ
jgi:Lipocalin-like domain